MKSKLFNLLTVTVLTCAPLCALAEETIRVSTSHEFLQALGSDRTILMEPGVYVLSDWDPYYEGKKEGSMTSMPRGVQWEEEFDGGELVIKGMKNLTIRCEGKDNAHIVVHPRYSYVLRFVECEDIVIENLLIGHSLGGFCTGGVFAFVNSSRISLTGLNMYGCGTEGMMMQNVSDMIVTGSSIFECTYYIMSVYDSKNIAFKDGLFFDNREFSLINVSNTQNMFFERCVFINNSGTMFSVGGNSISVSHSIFLNNWDQGYPIGHSRNVLFTNCSFEADIYQSGTLLGDRVRMRALPNINADIKRQLDKGTMLYVLKSSWVAQEEYPWYQVCYEGEFGWIYGEFLKLGGRLK